MAYPCGKLTHKSSTRDVPSASFLIYRATISTGLVRSICMHDEGIWQAHLILLLSVGVEKHFGVERALIASIAYGRQWGCHFQDGARRRMYDGDVSISLRKRRIFRQISTEKPTAHVCTYQSSVRISGFDFKPLQQFELGLYPSTIHAYLSVLIHQKLRSMIPYICSSEPRLSTLPFKMRADLTSKRLESSGPRL